jgi:hypothetical protein
MGFAPHTLSPYYLTEDAPSYQLFQIIVSIIQLFFGDNLAIACVTFMFLIFLLLLSILYFFTTFAEKNNYYIFCIMPALAFLLMHTTLFALGTFPFIISSWLAIVASFFYLKFYILSNTNGFYVNSKWLILSIFTGLISGFTHPIGIQIYLMGINFFILLSVFENRNRLQHFLTILLIDILFVLYNLITLQYFNQISAANFDLQKTLNLNIFDRFVWIVNGGGYDTSMLFPGRVSLVEPYIINVLGLLPFICLILGITLLLINKKKKEKLNAVNILVTYFLFIICAGIVFLPFGYGSLTIPFVRMYAVATPLILFIIFSAINSIRITFPAIIGPVLTILIVLSFVPVYSAAQDIVPFSDNVTIKLEQKIMELRESMPDNEKNLPVLLQYSASTFGGKSHEYRAIPFIMMNNKILYRNNIIIIYEWAPIGGRSLNYDYLDTIKTVNVYWKTESYPDINVTITKKWDPLQVSPKEINDNLVATIKNPQGNDGEPGSEFMWLGREMKLYLYWHGEKDQNITLSYSASAGPGDPTLKRIVEISMVQGKMQKSHIVESNGLQTISVPLIIQPGLNIVDFKSVFPEKASIIFPQDPREFLVYISQMRITGHS